MTGARGGEPPPLPTATGGATTVERLVAGARTGDQPSWDALVERFTPLLWSVCRRHRLSEADAADVVQSVWLRLLEHLDHVREPAALPGWLATTTARECVHLLRRESTRQERERVAGEQGVITTAVPSLDETVLAAERNDAIRAAFARLPERCRRLLALLAHDPPPSYAEIGERLQMPVGALGPTRARCLDKLRALEPLSSLIGHGAEHDGGRR